MTDATKQVHPFRAKSRTQGRPLFQRYQPATEGGDLCESASRRPSVYLASPALTAPLGSVTDVLNYNWDYAYGNDLPTLLGSSRSNIW